MSRFQAFGETGVVHQDVDVGEFRRQVGNGLVYGCPVPDVEFDGQDARTELPGQVGELAGPAGGRDDAGAVRREAPRDRGTEAVLAPVTNTAPG